MSKRQREITEDEGRLSKRSRTHPDDKLSALSDELVLKILAYLPISNLAICQRSLHFSLLFVCGH